VVKASSWKEGQAIELTDHQLHFPYLWRFTLKTFTSVADLGNFCAENCGTTAPDGFNIQVEAAQNFKFVVTGAEEFNCLTEIVDAMLAYGYYTFRYTATNRETVAKGHTNCALTKFEEAVRYDTMDEIAPSELMIAWLQFFYMDENFGLHPDDWTGENNGWSGWNVLLADQYFRRISGSDNMTYPCWIQRFKENLELFEQFHVTAEDDDGVDAIQQLRYFFNEGNIDDIENAITHMEYLLGYHSTLAEIEDENDIQKQQWDNFNECYFILKEIETQRDSDADLLFNQLMGDVQSMINEQPDINPAGEPC
jgi:hypothetical protein